MVTSAQCLKKYGDPSLPGTKSYLTNWKVPASILARTKVLPKVIYNINKDLVPKFEQALNNLIARELIDELKSWGGTYNVRMMKGNANAYSLHSWAIAVDLNVAENQYGSEPKLSPEFVACFKEVGFDWGGDWKKKDGMHFQLSVV